MKEELTTKMHSEFTVSQMTEVKLKVWSLLTLLNGKIDSPDYVMWRDSYGLDQDDVDQFYPSWLELKKKQNKAKKRKT